MGKDQGTIRVLFGSTEMLGTGVNAQERAVAVHHLDTPWVPSALEQRDGRAVRKGNWVAKQHADNKVDVIVYAVEKSLDSSQSVICLRATPDSMAALATAIDTSVIKRGSTGFGMKYSGPKVRLFT